MLHSFHRDSRRHLGVGAFKMCVEFQIQTLTVVLSKHVISML